MTLLPVTEASQPEGSKRDYCMLTEFWDQYRTYKADGARERTEVPVVGGGTVELYYSMSSVRAAFRPELPPFIETDAWGAAVGSFASEFDLLTDFRDDSYVLTNQEGVYYARLRPTEFLFTPERFEEQQDILEELVCLYRPAEPPCD